MTKKMTLGLIAVASLPVLIMGLYSSVIILNGCINANDFSMYHQAVIGLWEQGSLNPMVPVRGTRMLNDHFEPILWLAGLWVGVFGPDAIHLGLFELLTGLLTTCLPLIFGRTRTEKIGGVILLVFCRALLQGLEFPVHPATWSAPLAWLLGLMLAREKYKEATLIALTLPLFREIYPFMAIGLALWFLLIRQYRYALTLIPLMSGWIVFSMWGRPALLGPTSKFHGNLAADFLSDPLATLWMKFAHPGIQWNLFAQYIPLIALLIWTQRKHFKLSHPLVGVFSFMLPGLGIHFLVGRMAHHHGIPMALPLVAALTVLALPLLFQGRRPKLLATLCLLPLVLTSTSRYQRALKLPLKGGDFRCEIGAEKRAEMQEFLGFAQTLSAGKKVLATGDVIPILASTKLELYQVSPYSYPEPVYDYLALSQPGIGDPWPLSQDQQRAWRERCLPHGQIIFENARYTILEGAFTMECIQLQEIWNLGRNQTLRVRQK